MGRNTNTNSRSKPHCICTERDPLEAANKNTTLVYTKNAPTEPAR